MSGINDFITLSSDSEDDPDTPQIINVGSSEPVPGQSTQKPTSAKTNHEKPVNVKNKTDNEKNGVEKRVTRSQNEEAMKRVSRTLKGLQVTEQFMAAFDPENSNRERRKLSRFEAKKQTPPQEKDLCDCLLEKCPGCFFPCLTCKSPKCGVTCRNNRQTSVQTIESDPTRCARYHPSIQTTFN